MSKENKIKTWKNKIIYQIFPRSFKDSNNDGDGDIKGIIQKLPYLRELGITAIWLNPTYDTDFKDAGYDVLDYKTVWKQFGTLNDFKKMVVKANEFGIDIIMDIVLNHVSNKHPWFKKAIQSVENVEHDYFIWRDKLTNAEAKATSLFGGSAWEYIPSVKKYYFHLFAKEQIDLNWNHPSTIEAMADVIDFWYKLGVKGFRLDAIKHVDKQFPDGTSSYHSWQKNSVKQLKEFSKIAFHNKPDAFTFGEASGITLDEMIKYGTGKDKVSDNFYNFSWWHIGWGKLHGRNDYNPNWEYYEFYKMMKPFQENKKISTELMTNFLSNHDTSRAVSRWGDDGLFHKESAKMLAMLLFVMKGIPCIYYGEEIGMTNPGFSSRKDFRDIDAINHYIKLVDNEKVFSEYEMTKYHNMNSRDNCRTPMAWDSSASLGFNKDAKPWIKFGKNFEENNVKIQLKDPNSILNFYKELIQLRLNKKYNSIFVDGTSKLDYIWEVKTLKEENPKTKKITTTKVNTGKGYIKVERKIGDHKIIGIINNSNNQMVFKVPKDSKAIISSWSDIEKTRKILRPYEAIFYFK